MFESNRNRRLSRLLLAICAPGIARRTAPHRREARTSDAGVTLIEMMVVLVIIAIVAVMVVPNVIGRPDQARVTVTTTDLRTISSALEMYRLDNRTYPTTDQGLAALVSRPTTSPIPRNWHENGYLAAMPQDAWGAPYIYASPGTDGAFDLVSLGADGKPGGDGVDADIDLRSAAQ